MKYEIYYHDLVLYDDLKKIASKDKQMIKKAIEEKLMKSPELFGKPLRKSLKGFRKLRVGDYRVVFRIEKESVKIFIIKHRSIVYQLLSTRL